MSATHELICATACSLDVDPGADLPNALADSIRGQLDGRRVDLLVAFASAHFEDELPDAVAALHERLSPRAFIGCSAEAVISRDRELESQPGLSVWAASLPRTQVCAFHLSEEDVQRLSRPGDWHDQLGVDAAEEPHFLVLADPFSVNILTALERLGQAFPGRPAVGGIASAGEAPRQNLMVFDGQVLRHGMSAVALWGGVRMEAVVSQGCRPIGRHVVITKADENVIYQLGGKPPLNVVQELLAACSGRDQQLAQRRGLLVGRVINERQGTFATGDFLIRNPLGFDANTGAMAVSDLVRAGQTIQFHVRDSVSAGEELAAMLAAAPCNDAAGALLFSCNGRGTRLFSDRHHDARAVHISTGGKPLAGFFCAGEIGPVGDRNFLHGHTASIALFRAAPSNEP